jgi:S1-C subfamily serine protease
MPQPYSSERKKIPVWLIVLLVIIGVWWVAQRGGLPRYDRNAEPRAVAARGDLAEDEKNTIDIFRNASPAVVFITSIGLQRNFFSLNVYEIPQGTGSGFVWDSQGHIVTNYHVIEDANRVEVTLADNSTWKGTLVGAEPDKDLAVLQISAPADLLKPIPVGQSDNLLVGQKVFAIGNPFGLDQTITSGIVSALGREIKAETGRAIRDVIQTDAAINPGNSGGPLLDSAGRLIGVNTAIYSPTGSSAGIGFAVPVGVVNKAVPELIRHGKTIRPALGVAVANEAVARRFGIGGVLIITVQPGSSAEAAGLRSTREVRGGLVLGDIIEEVNGTKISSYDDLQNELDRYKVGDMVKLSIRRDDQSLTLEVRLQEAE